MNNPGVKEMLALLDALKDAVRDFAAREEKWSADSHIRTAAGARLAEEAAAARTNRMADRVEKENAGHAVERSQRDARYENRKARINRAHASARKQITDQISGEQGQFKDRVHVATQEAAQHRDAALAETVVVLENFRVKVAEAAESLGRSAKRVRGAFGGYGKFKRMLELKLELAPDLSADENRLFEQFQQLQKKVEGDLDGFKNLLLPKIFRFLPVWLIVLLLLAIVAAVPVLQRFAVKAVSWPLAGAAAVVPVVLLVFYFYGSRSSAPRAKTIADGLAKARRSIDAAAEKAELHYQQGQERIKGEYEAAVRDINQKWRTAVRGAMDSRDIRPTKVDEHAKQVYEKNEVLYRAGLKQLEERHAAMVARLRQEMEEEARAFSAGHEAKTAALAAGLQSQWQALEAEWKKTVLPLFEQVRAAGVAAEKMFPEWQGANWESWRPPADFKNAAQFARMEVDIEKFAETVPKDKRLALPEPKLSVPLALTCPQQGSILFETTKGGENEAVAEINNIIFRLLSTTPAGKASFTIFDPVGLGQNFAALMHLADYEEGAINSRIWTQTTQFEEKLAELNEHMEKVIQMYLRNEYPTIADYNARAGSIAEKYHFLVIASFPVNFSETAAKRLRNIAANGARCGVYTLVHWDQRQPAPRDFVPDELRKNSVRVLRSENNFYLSHWHPAGTKLVLDAPPSPEFATKFLHDVGQSSKDSARVEVPFAQIAPPDAKIWSVETTEELRVSIGRSGATKLQYLEIGKGTRQHALIAGKTGSGKSTLFHIIITNLALWCSPEQVEFYLVDFKKGVEFKCYASRHLPHAKVVAIESDRAFGLSVLQRIDDELRRRGDLFRQLGVQDVAGYKRAGGKEPMPRSLLLIDEFQEFFTEEDRVSQAAAVLLDRIVRQGRAFGIHVVLGSQTLGGAYTLARATIGQMVIRIALQCNEADAYLIMDQDNPAPRLLTRPGEGIYNDAAGAIEGNSPFQAVWLSEEVRDNYLEQVRAKADAKKYPGPFVFEGSAPADVRENLLLRELLEGRADLPVGQDAPQRVPTTARAWLGAPNSIKGPTEVVFQRQSGSNLLVVGQSEERSLTLLAVALASLAAQFPKNAARFYVFDATPQGFSERDFIERVVKVVPHEVVQVNNTNLGDVMNGLAQELKKRSDDGSGPEIFLLVNGLQNFKKLRNEDEFSFSSSDSGEVKPGAAFQNLINEGPAHGIHVLVTCDTYNNVNRSLGRKALTEFEMRVLFQMSAADSASLVDSPDGSTLGLHRALYYNDREGYTEIFRPYARPGNDWVEDVARQLLPRK